MGSFFGIATVAGLAGVVVEGMTASKVALGVILGVGLAVAAGVAALLSRRGVDAFLEIDDAGARLLGPRGEPRGELARGTLRLAPGVISVVGESPTRTHSDFPQPCVVVEAAGGVMPPFALTCGWWELERGGLPPWPAHVPAPRVAMPVALVAPGELARLRRLFGA